MMHWLHEDESHTAVRNDRHRLPKDKFEETVAPEEVRGTLKPEAMLGPEWQQKSLA